MTNTNFSFDVGMTSLGVAVNTDGDIIHADVLLMHAEAGSVQAQSERRRQYRTRQAHKARERALENLWRAVGKTPLQRKRFEKNPDGKRGRKFIKTAADQRLEREFPAKGDDTVYASSLLRIMLLEGAPLQDWQIYKALHAAIQRRGYDAEVPWRSREEDDEAKESQTKAGDFDKRLAAMTANPKCQLPCYYDAWRMGMWDDKTEKIAHIRQPQRSPQKKKDQARGYTPSRKLVTEELTRLLEQAAKQVAGLQQHLANDNGLRNTLYGDQQNAITQRYPSAGNIDGLLGQKYPRFENRIVSKCALSPKRNACKAEKPLAIEATFLMKLINWRYERDAGNGEKQVCALTGAQIKAVFDECAEKWRKKNAPYDAKKYAVCFKLTPTQVKKLAREHGGVEKVGHETIEAGKCRGRSRFSQPSLHLLKKLILSEKTPKAFYDELSQSLAAKRRENRNAQFGHQLFADVPYKYRDDDIKFLAQMGERRESISIQAVGLAERYGLTEDGDIDGAVHKVINSCNWPELRHRLNVFYKQLGNMIDQFGAPHAVHLEFVREDFLGTKAKGEYTKRADAGRKDRQDAITALKESGISASEENVLRYRLFNEQNKQCLYTGDALSISQLESYERDHIHPRSDGGPDAQYNYALTTRETNIKKGDRLPCECDFIVATWASYKERLNLLKLGGGKNRSSAKKRLLLASTRQEAGELIEKYTGLSGTAHIARLARDIVCLRLGWQPGEKGATQKVFTFSGGLTSKVARKYKLYTALGDGAMEYQKDRSDHRHHALDAMVISYLREWARDAKKTEFFKFPKGINAKYFAEKLQGVYPRYITRMRPAIAEMPKPIGAINRAEFKNISKDPTEHGQWYTNKSESGKGTSQHGYLFYKDAEGKVHAKTIHSFRSPYNVRKEMEGKGVDAIGLFRNGMSIRLPQQDAVTATQLGRSARLPFGEYKIIKVNKKETVIALVRDRDGRPTDDESVHKYRMPFADIASVVTCNQLLSAKKPFALDGFAVDQDTVLTGNYRVEEARQSWRNFAVVDVKTGEQKFVKFASLVRHLVEQQWANEPVENDVFEINGAHPLYLGKATANDLPSQVIPAGIYIIKAFSGNAKVVILMSQNGCIYRGASEILGLAESVDN